MPSGIYSGKKRKGFQKGHKPTEITCKKISESHLGKKRGPHTKETKRKMSIARMGIKYSNKTREKMSISQTGKKQSEETKEKNRVSHLGKKYKPMSKEGRENIKKSRIGKKTPEEVKKKIQEWNIAHPNKKFKDTKIELKIEKELQKRNINYKKQVPLCKIAIVDFYLPESKTVIQCDGCYWHGCPIHYPNQNSKKNIDIKQNAILILNDLKVYRFWEHEINESAEECLNKLN